MSQRPGFARKDMRKRHELLVSLGYALVSSDGHLRYEHPDQPPLVVPGTPVRHGHHMDRLMQELRKRHPDEPRLAARARGHYRKPGELRRQEKARRLREAMAQVSRSEADRLKRAKPQVTTLDYTGCPACGYRWKSDLPAAGRPCPTIGCDGVIEIGRAAA